MQHRFQRPRFLLGATALTIALTALALATGCSSPVSPTVPLAGAARISPVLPVPAPDSMTSAVVSIENAFAIGGPEWTCTKAGCQPGPGYLYEVRFLLRELGGKSGATVQTVVVRNPSQRQSGTYAQETGEGCWRDPLRVKPLGTLDIFYTDAGSQWLSYCYVGIDGTPGVAGLELEVKFVDDEGIPGNVTTTVTSFRNQTGASQ